ncbi:tRNA pseudouridine synthase A [Bienertia sinuspersici]
MKKKDQLVRWEIKGGFNVWNHRSGTTNGNLALFKSKAITDIDMANTFETTVETAKAFLSSTSPLSVFGVDSIVLVALSSHVLPSLHIPTLIANCIDALISAFWWQSSPISGIPWVKRQTLHLPKAMSSLGMKQAYAWKIGIGSIPACSTNLVQGNFSEVQDHITLRQSALAKEPETYQHLFRLCPLVQRIWALSSLGICSSINLSKPFHQWVKEFLLLFIEQDGHTGSRLSTVVGILWAIWISRNNAIFHNDQVTIPSILHNIAQSAATYTTYTSFLQSSPYQIPRKPLDTPPGFLLADIGQKKENISHPIVLVDGSWSPIDNSAGSAWILSASPTQGGAFFSKTTSAFQTGALALLHGLLSTHNLDFSDILVYTDSSLLIQGLQYRSTSIDSNWVIKDIINAGFLFNNCRILKVNLLQIQLAHDRAKECRSCFISFKSS